MSNFETPNKPLNPNGPTGSTQGADTSRPVEQPKSAPAPDTNSAPTPDPSPIEDITPGNYQKKELFSPHDIAVALDFAQRWLAADEGYKSVFIDTMSLNNAETHADVILGLIPSNGRVSAAEFILNTRIKNFDESMSRADIRAWGVELATTVADMDDAEIRLIVRMINFLTPNDYHELRYRRNMSSSDTVDMISDAIDSITEENIKRFTWVVDMLNIWPIKVQ